MQNLFLVDGASGTGKSDLLKLVTDYSSDETACFVTKWTTRSRRDYEQEDAFLLDLKFTSEVEFQSIKPEFSYRYGRKEYGFTRQDLEDALQRSDNVFVIVRNVDLIRRISKEYGYLNVVPLFVYTDERLLESRLQDEGLTDEQVRFRMERSARATADYYEHSEIYREVLINNSSKDRFHSLISKLLEKHRSAPKIDPYLVAVMMSFNPSNPMLEDYYGAMERAVTSLSTKLHCTRVDKFVDPVAGTPKISVAAMHLMQQARCVLVDLTENKQNVYYELGVAQGTGKTCIITAVSGTQVFFYPREHRILFYDSASDLERKLRIELRGIFGWVAAGSA